MRSYRRVERAAVLALAATLVLGCGDDPATGPQPSAIRTFELRQSGALLYDWNGSVAPADTIRLSAGDSILVEFRWFDSSGTRVNLPSNAELTVNSSSPGIARWVPHPSNESMGSFVTVGLLQPVTTAVQVRLDIGASTPISTSFIPVKVSP